MKPLSSKQRARSLWTLGIVFILAAPVIVLYSLGYRWDQGLSFQKTGGIFIHSNIANTSIFIDDKFHKNSGGFFRNLLVQDLLPDARYNIRVQKEGYQSWVKDIDVYPSVVSEGAVLMLPEKFEKREIYRFVDEEGVATSTAPVKGQTKPTNKEFVSVSELFASSTKPDIAKAVATNATSSATTSIEEQKSELELFFETLGIENHDKLKNLVVNGKEVSWLDKGDIKLYWMDDSSSIPYYYCSGQERSCANDIILDWGDEIRKFEYFPGRNDVWIALTSNGIYAVEVDGRTQRNIQNVYVAKDLDFRLTQTDRLIIKEGQNFFEITL